MKGDHFGPLFIIATVIPGDEIIKVINKTDDVRDAWKLVGKLFSLWDKLMTTPGGQKILNKMPQNWKDLPGSKLADGEGLYWKNGTSNLRIMDANPASALPSQQVQYVRLTKNGSRLDINGNPVPSTLPGGIENPDFQELTHLPLSGITDDLLDLFFN